MDQESLISIIIPTRNRKEYLERFLQSLEGLRAPGKFEVIVIDNASDDGTATFLETYQKKSSYSLNIIKNNKRKGPGASRNQGVEIAQGSVFSFLDDDCLVSQDWMIYLRQALEQKQVGAIGGPDQFYPGDSNFSKCVDYLMTSFLTTGGSATNCPREIARERFPSFSLKYTLPSRSLLNN